MNSPKVTVIGSLNIDYIASVQRLPRRGETVAAKTLLQRYGGKGANQALAAARLGASVSIVGCVGADDSGRSYSKRLRDAGINAAGLTTTSRALTGTALIAVDRIGENTIVVAPGANGELKPAAVRARRTLITRADVVLLQFEVPMRTVIEAVRIASQNNVPLLLNPSPLQDGFPWGKYRLDTVIVNAGEAGTLFNLPANDLPARPAAWQRAISDYRIDHLIITRGPNSTLCVTSSGVLEAPTLSVKPLDTVGAGDAFAGTFAAKRAEGADLASALRWANCAGALATLKAGAQESIPTRAAVQRATRRSASGLVWHLRHSAGMMEDDL